MFTNNEICGIKQIVLTSPNDKMRVGILLQYEKFSNEVDNRVYYETRI